MPRVCWGGGGVVPARFDITQLASRLYHEVLEIISQVKKFIESQILQSLCKIKHSD